MARCIASAATTALRGLAASASASRATYAPSIWLRMTPELPRAPRSAPRANDPEGLSRVEVRILGDRPATIASRAAETVRNMLVPVSPSGTG